MLSAGCALFNPKASPTTTEAVVSPARLRYVSGSPMLWMDGSNFVYVEGGEFTMGADTPGGSDITPAHTVNLQGFWIQQTEVTNRMYAQCVEQGKCNTPIREDKAPYWYSDPRHADDPVVGVTWSNALDYCTWIQATLPTEAQWEKSARGIEGFNYPWGNIDPTCDLLNYQGCLTPARVNRVFSYPEGASPYNAMDMGGNIYEWVKDWYAASYYSISPAADPPGPDTGTQRVTRSSSFNSLVDAVLVTERTPLEPTKHTAELGFRCVLAGDKDIQGFAPPCTTGALIPQAVPPEVPTDGPTPIQVRSAFCESKGVGVVTIYFPEWDAGDGPTGTFEFSATGGEIICSDLSDGHSVECYGSALVPGTYVTVTICPLQVPTFDIEPTCPTGYTLDMEDGLCHYDITIVGAGPDSCTAEEFWYEGYGCLPVSGDSPAPCPPGYVQMEFPGEGTLCVPVSIGTVPDTCLVGTLVSELNCCQVPGSTTPACPLGWSYDSETHRCHEDAPSDQCQTFTFYIPPCPTTPPPQISCEPQTCPPTSNQVWCQSLCACIDPGKQSCP